MHKWKGGLDNATETELYKEGQSPHQRANGRVITGPSRPLTGLADLCNWRLYTREH